MGGKLLKPKLLRRKRIHKILEGIFQVPLFLLLSSMGYGKTTAVKDFLNSQRNFRYAWLSLNSGEDDELWMWQKFCQSLADLNPELAKRLAGYGFPQTTVDLERILDLIKNMLAERTIIVIDDYHENRSELMDRLLTFFVRAAIHNLHIVLISRTLPKIPVEELALKGLCIELSQDSFEFNKEETGELFAQNGFPLTPEELKLLYINTDGWAAAIYLALLKYAEDKKIEDIRDVTRLMKTAVYDKFNRETQDILLKLSLLDSFTLDGAIFVTENQRAGELIHGIAANNCFLRYDNKNRVYAIHAILKAMLNELFAISDLDKYSLLDRCGDYCVRMDKCIEAINFYREAGSFRKILDIFERPGSTEVFDRAPQTVVRAFTDMDKVLKLSRPLAYLTYIYSYLGVIDPEEGARMLYEAKAYYEAEQNLVDKEQILGEIALAESVLQFNDAPRMCEYQKKAYDMFDGTSSRISNATENFTFGLPHTLYLYHREGGALLSLVEAIEKNINYFNHVTNGCGTGFEHAARAEYCLETGDLVQAELAAYKTIFKAKTKNQLCLVICGSLCLARLAILHNKPQEALSGLSALKPEIEADGNPFLLNCLDIATGFIAGLLGNLEQIPRWLKEGALSNGNIFYQGMGISYIVSGKAAILRQSYAELEVIVETMRETYLPHNHIFGLIYAGIYGTIAKKHLHGEAAAQKKLCPIIELAQADGIVTPFAENLPELVSLLKKYKKDQDDPWLEEVLQLGGEYMKALENTEGTELPESLTGREIDVLVLLSDGFSKIEIAEKLYLSPNTVKRHLQNIYAKLGADNKTLAIKKAQELKIIM